MDGRCAFGLSPRQKDNSRLRRQLKFAWDQVAAIKQFLSDYGMVWVGETPMPPNMGGEGEEPLDLTPPLLGLKLERLRSGRDSVRYSNEASALPAPQWAKTSAGVRKSLPSLLPTAGDAPAGLRGSHSKYV
jgi:hypothetical protein